MSTICARSPLTSLPMATNRPTTRRRSAKQAFVDEEPPAPKRARTEAPAPTKRASATTRKPAKAAAYDEDDDGFTFTRRTSRRTTASKVEITAEDGVPAPVRRKRTSGTTVTTVTTAEVQTAGAQKTRRSTRLSAEKAQLEVRPESTEPVAAPKRKKKQTTPALDVHAEEKRAHASVQTPTHNELQVAKKRDPNAQRIMLPFADTPIITRNKEMRKGSKDGHRRSSTGLRGRRASSLIDTGMSNALPHSEVQVRDFYKYIEQSLPEPRRMKQLLIWCGSRALPEKPSGDVKDVNAIMAARAIQQELIDDFASKPELFDWFSREETAPPPVVKRPNPQNEKNQATLEELEEEVKRLEDEMAAWEALASSTPPLDGPPPAPSIPTAPPTLSSLDPALLSPSQAAILDALQPPAHTDSQPSPSTTASTPKSTFRPPTSLFTFTSPTGLTTHLSTLAASLEPTIDLFAHGVHSIEQYRRTAERAADAVLGTASRALEEREREVKGRVGAEGIGVGDVLRGLAGVLAE